MTEYTSELMEKGFMEEREKEGKKIYALTDKGLEYVNEFQRMKRFSESFGL
jgi:predicted transcriptional regulator